MSIVLVVNSGSSSMKYRLIDMRDETVLASGLIERIGEYRGLVRHDGPNGRHELARRIVDHEAAFEAMIRGFNEHGPSLDDYPPVAVGHRVVQGARRFLAPTVVDDSVERDIEDLIPLAPLHNGANLEGIRGARRAFPDLPHVTVFDTSFHTSMSDAASLYALDRPTAERYRIRRYGAHGSSHKFVSAEAARFLGKPLEDLKIIVLHIGNGASACAVRGGVSIETSMGLTPLEGLVMGTRTGDIDPAVLFHLHRQAGYSVDDLDELLNKKSGLAGLTGSNDMRDVEARARKGDALALTALEIYAHRIRHYIGAYHAQLGGADAVVWTAGVGENSPDARARAMRGLEFLGMKLDPELNDQRVKEPTRISAADSAIDILVVPTNEELEIARQTLQATGIPADA
ncbi:acetate kinase [Pseudoclavibacter alba]|uniref:Acetate kinase n=1 Tax=Pseudoclavibacter albus TaxID=272241 RepID=A0ABT2HYI4_9MICO|nr:acetate kinase [Pseudoclavibacter alba]MBN6778386.1 acetate kinase [Pseudoclavibacter alba]MCT2043384.1 acetate kinase [Pseudoclavibacter alba]